MHGKEVKELGRYLLESALRGAPINRPGGVNGPRGKPMRELDFINIPSPTPHAAITTYVDMYAYDLLEQAVMEIRAATRLSNKELDKTLVANRLYHRKRRRLR